MKIADQLDGLRAQFPACDIAAFADLSTGMVLASTAAKKITQERLDDLCRCAADALRGPLFKTVGGTIVNRETDTISYVIRLSASGVELFVEAPAESDEALCLVCAHGVDVDGLVQTARALLDKFEVGH